MEHRNNGRAIAAMLIAMSGFILNDTLVKLSADALPLGQIIFVRGVISSILIAIVCYVTGVFRLLPMLRHPAVLVRAAAETAATVFYLSALFHLPIANATAILQALPLVVTAGAAIFLKNKVGWRRWTAIAIGFVGILIIVRPGLQGFNAFSLLALAGVSCMAVRDLATQQVPKEVPTFGVALVSFIAVTTLGAGLTAVDGWQAMSLEMFSLLVGASLFIIVGYIFIIIAMRTGEIAVVSPFRYSIVIWAIGLGFLVWGDVPDGLTLVGTSIVILMGIYTFFREQHITNG
ncbi:MAG: DMT family transporter [Roseibium sp.]